MWRSMGSNRLRRPRGWWSAGRATTARLGWALPRRWAVRATVTVALAGIKEGFFALEAQPFLGEVVVADIGVPRELLDRLGRRLMEPHADAGPPAPPPPEAPSRPGSASGA